MKLARHAVISILALLLFGHLVFQAQEFMIPQGTAELPNNSHPGIDAIEEIRPEYEELRSYGLSEEPLAGNLNPVSIKQSGVYKSANYSARTDIGFNSERNITIDEENGWFASQAMLEAWNLKRLYAENGTFQDGTSAWGTYLYDPDGDQVQSTSYNSTGEYVTMKNEGELTNIPQHIYTHWDQSQVLWTQTVNNTPLTQDFSFSVKFLYKTGPLDPEGDDYIYSQVYLAVFFDGSGWGRDLTTLPARNEWNTWEFDAIGTGVGGTFSFEVGLFINWDTDLDADLDYDDDGLPDAGNASTIELYIDDVILESIDTIGFSDVEMTFYADTLEEEIVGIGGIGTAIISNPSLWTGNHLPIEITSDLSVSFDYRVSLDSARYTNSSFAADPTKSGVHYSTNLGSSPSLTFYTYIGTSGVYENFTLHIEHPVDWQNATVRNPFLNDVTSSCTIEAGAIYIPNSLMDYLGWWEVKLESPNYAKSILTQKFDTGLWSEASVFGSNNVTRTRVELGTVSSIPTIADPVSFSWVMPNGTLWSEDSISSGTLGVVDSSARVLGGPNTTIGEWTVFVAWNNGSEIAYGAKSFEMHHSATLSLVSSEYSTIETDSGLVVTNFLYFRDADNNEYITDETATLVANWSGSQITFDANPIKNWWEADFDTSIVGNGRFVVIVNASRPYYNSVSLQFTIISTHQTDFQFTSIGGIPPEIGLYEVYEVNMHYELETGPGIEDADVSMTFIGPDGGLSLQTADDDGLGDYSAFIVASEAGTYMVTFTCSKDYHYNGTDSFTLIVGEIDTALSVTNGTSGFVSFGRSYRLVVFYENGTGHGLDSATLEVAQVTPSSGLGYTTFSDIGNGYYAITLTPSSASTWTILIKANLTNHVTQYATFTLVVNEVPTVLTATVPGATVTIGENYVIELFFQDEDSTGLQGATITILNPPSGLNIGTPADMTGGYYNVDITALTAGTFQILFRASLPNHLNSTVGFTLVVNGFGSEFICVNGTADFTLFGETYRLVVRYTNTTGFGLAGADIQVVNVIPATGLDIGTAAYEGDGYYSLILNASSAIIFTLLIKANLTDYSTQFVTFSFIVRETPTVLTLDDYEAEIAGDQQHTVQLLFADEDSNGLEGAIIDVLNPPEELTFYSVLDLGSGYYNITIEPSEIGTFLIAFRAYLMNYQNATAGFTLIVSPAPTILIILEGISSDTVLFEDEYLISLVYYRTDTGTNVSGAQISVDWIPLEGLTIVQSRVGDIYYISIDTHAIGTWTLFIAANKTAHATSITQFTLRVNSHATTVNEFTLLEALIYEGSYVFDFSYAMLNGTGISGATITPSGSGVQWITYDEISQGVYRVNLTPEAVGNYEIAFAFSKDGYQSRTSILSFVVDPVIVQIIQIQGLDGLEGETNTISLRLVRADNGLPVSGAIVEFQLVDETGPRLIDTLEEATGQPGLYSCALTMPSAVSVTYLRIFVTLENFALSTDYHETQMSPQVSEMAALSRMVQTYFPFLLLLVVGVVGYSGRAAYLRRARARNIEAMVVKRRFDDVQSLLGVIVLHKHTGIPIFSRIVKGGLDETLVSGFISAITTFRKEFEIDQESESIIPISDIIRAISTENLICAFISLTAPSKAQELRMVEFAEAVGFVFDGMYTEPPARSLDPGTASQFEALFDDLMDGKLLKMYKITEPKGIARGPRCLVRKINEVDEEGEFELQTLASRMASCGIEEARAYQIIWDALEKESIIAVHKEESPSTYSLEE